MVKARASMVERRRHITYCNRRASLTAYRCITLVAGFRPDKQTPARFGAAHSQSGTEPTMSPLSTLFGL
jgi:hypothetical protein